ncbi:MAG: hypothetical protein ACPL4K_02580 [Candidatus Margulisiibacteriota bacterium]
MGGVGNVNFSESGGTTFVYSQKAAVIDEGKILLNPKNPVFAAQKVKDLVRKGLIKVEGNPEEIKEKVEIELRKARAEGKKSIALDDIINYDIKDQKKLQEELRVTSKDAKDPFATVIDEKTRSKVNKALEGLHDIVVNNSKNLKLERALDSLTGEGIDITK